MKENTDVMADEWPEGDANCGEYIPLVFFGSMKELTVRSQQ